MAYRSRLIAVACGALLGLLAVRPAGAAPSCLRDARRDALACRADCREAFQSAKDGCLDKDHACVESCRAGRAACVDASGLEVALDACDDGLAAARATCRQTTAAGTAERDACVDAAQQVAFQCRDAAREAAQPALAACRTGFRTCAAACPAGGGAAADNPRRCRRDANRAFHACYRTCGEDLQVSRDACLHRDHACVESCRDDRAACSLPVRTQLRTDVAACVATRDAAVATCHTLYADGTAELDQCIDNAQVAAFTCRDTAHETARPGALLCRSQFRDCARACPQL